MGAGTARGSLVQSLSRRDWLLESAALATGMALAPLAQAETRPYGILGHTAPEVASSFWIDPEGNATSFSVTESRGKWVYVKCFQSWCPGCHKYGFPALKEVSDHYYGDSRFVAVGLQTVFEGFGVNTQDKVREIQLQYELPITMGHDAGNPNGDYRPQTMRRYRTGGTPWVVIIDPAGRVVYNDFHIDPDRFIEYLDTKLV